MKVQERTHGHGAQVTAVKCREHPLIEGEARRDEVGRPRSGVMERTPIEETEQVRRRLYDVCWDKQDEPLRLAVATLDGVVGGDGQISVDGVSLARPACAQDKGSQVAVTRGRRSAQGLADALRLGTVEVVYPGAMA